MARPGITEQQIIDAANQLRNKKQDATLKNVREIIGTGSFSTISKTLEKWRENNPIQEPTDTRDLMATPHEMENKQREMLDEIIRLQAKIDVLTEAQDKTSEEIIALRLENVTLEGLTNDARNLANDMLKQNEQLETVLATMYKFKIHEIVKIFINTDPFNKNIGYLIFNVLVLSYPKTKIDGIKKPVLCDFTVDGQKAIFDEDSLLRYEFNDPYPDLSKAGKYHKKPKKPRYQYIPNK